MKKIPTAEEFLNDIKNVTYSEEEKLIIFAKLHVEAALKAASEKALVRRDTFVMSNVKTETERMFNYSDGRSHYADTNSILNSYLIDKIK